MVFWGAIVSLAKAVADAGVEGWEGATDGETLHAASRRMMVMDIPSLFDLLALDHVCIIVIDQSIPGHG
jgi:hypothetical protein